MNKTLKFDAHLVPLILNGSKTSTWRLWDDKNLFEGDVVDLLGRPSLEKIATAKLTKVIIKKFRDLTSEDKMGHESFSSDEEMYKTFADAYKQPVTLETEVKIIWFGILE